MSEFRGLTGTAKQKQVTEGWSGKRPDDHNIYCYRPNNELYVVVLPSKWKRLREQGKLDSYLRSQRK